MWISREIETILIRDRASREKEGNISCWFCTFWLVFTPRTKNNYFFSPFFPIPLIVSSKQNSVRRKLVSTDTLLRYLVHTRRADCTKSCAHIPHTHTMIVNLEYHGTNYKIVFMNILSLILSNFCKESFYEDGEILFFGLIFSPNFINLSFVDTKMIFSSSPCSKKHGLDPRSVQFLSWRLRQNLRAAGLPLRWYIIYRKF